MSQLKKLPRIIGHCMTIGMIPTSYKVSLTYEEQLMWFCKFLEEEVIPVVNNNSQVTEELKNYFETLDVQEEINNKLEEMAENGELEEIIAEFLQLQALFTYNSVEDMKAAENLIDGSFAQTLGYYSTNDGGASLYKIRSITNQDEVDEMFIVSLNNENLIAELITIDDSVNIKQLGAIEDEKDEATKNTSIINTALEKERIVIVPEGNYYVESITMAKETELKGTTNMKSKLIYYGTSNNSIIKIGNVSSYIFNTKIDNLNLTLEDEIQNINGIEYIGMNPAYSIIEKCTIENLTGDGIKGGESGHVNNVEIKECYITYCKNGINMQYGAGQINAIWVHHNNISHCENGILFYGNNVIIESNTIQANTIAGVSVGNDEWDEAHNMYCYGSKIVNNYTELNETPIIIYSGYVTGRSYNRLVRKLEISNNYHVEHNADLNNNIVKLMTDETSDISAKATQIIAKNNYSETRNYMTNPNTLSYGSEIINNSIYNDITNYPYYVVQPTFNLNEPANPHHDNYTNVKYCDFENFSTTNKQLTFLIYCDSSILSAGSCDVAIRQMLINGSVNGWLEYGYAGRYNCKLEKIGSNIETITGSVDYQYENDTTKAYNPVISPLTLVKNHPDLTGNATLGLQVTIMPRNDNAFPYSLFLDMFTRSNATKYIKVKKLTPTKFMGAGTPSRDPNYIGEVYFNTTNNTWYFGDTLTSWKSTSIVE